VALSKGILVPRRDSCNPRRTGAVPCFGRQASDRRGYVEDGCERRSEVYGCSALTVPSSTEPGTGSGPSGTPSTGSVGIGSVGSPASTVIGRDMLGERATKQPARASPRGQSSKSIYDAPPHLPSRHRNPISAQNQAR